MVEPLEMRQRTIVVGSLSLFVLPESIQWSVTTFLSPSVTVKAQQETEMIDNQTSIWILSSCATTLLWEKASVPLCQQSLLQSVPKNAGLPVLLKHCNCSAFGAATL